MRQQRNWPSQKTPSSQSAWCDHHEMSYVRPMRRCSQRASFSLPSEAGASSTPPCDATSLALFPREPKTGACRNGALEPRATAFVSAFLWETPNRFFIHVVVNPIMV